MVIYSQVAKRCFCDHFNAVTITNYLTFAINLYDMTTCQLQHSWRSKSMPLEELRLRIRLLPQNIDINSIRFYLSDCYRRLLVRNEGVDSSGKISTEVSYADILLHRHVTRPPFF